MAESILVWMYERTKEARYENAVQKGWEGVKSSSFASSGIQGADKNDCRNRKLWDLKVSEAALIYMEGGVK